MDAVQLLLQAGASVAAKSSCVPSYLFLFSAHSPSSPAQLLIPPTLFHSKGKTAAEIAADQGHSGIAQLLQQHAVMRPPFCVSELALLYTLTLEN